MVFNATFNNILVVSWRLEIGQLKCLHRFCWYWWNCWPSLFKLSSSYFFWRAHIRNRSIFFNWN